MATQLDKGHHKVTNDLLQLIKWENKSGEMNTLRLYALLASVWVKVSDLMNLDVSTTTTIATKYNGDPEKCIHDVIGRWMNDQEKLSDNYKCTWSGLCQLLEDLQLSTASSQLKEALAADISSFNANIQRQEAPARILDHHDKTSQDFIAPFARTKQHEGKRPKVLHHSICFPALELETITEDERAQLLATLQLESHDMICNFADILINFDDFLIQQSTTIDSVAHMKRILFKVLKIPPLHKEETSSSLISNLSNATTIDEISIILSKYCSFFNYKLLETVFTHMKYDEGHKALRRHEEDLIEYAKRRICRFPSGLGIRGFNHAIIAVKLDDMYEGTLTVHLLTFHRKLCELLRLTLGQCPLDGLKPGCICVTLHLLGHLVKDSFPLSIDQQAALQSLTCNGSKIRSLTCEPFTYILADDQSTTTEMEPKEAMEQKCGLQESEVEEKEHNIKETQSEEKIQPDKMKIITTTSTQKLLEYLKQETSIERKLNFELFCLQYQLEHTRTLVDKFTQYLLIPYMREQTALTQELYEWLHKMKMPTSALTSLRSDADLLGMEEMLHSNRSVENCLLVLQKLIKSQEEYHEVRKRFIDEYYDKLKDEVKQHKEHSSELSQDKDNIRELQSEIDCNNQEIKESVRLCEELKLKLSGYTEEFSSEKPTPTKHSMLLPTEPKSSLQQLKKPRSPRTKIHSMQLKQLRPLKKPQVQIPPSPQRDQSTTTEMELKEAMEQKCGLQESRVEEKEHNIKETQSEEKIQTDKMEIIITKTQKLLEYLKQETSIGQQIDSHFDSLHYKLSHCYGHKGRGIPHISDFILPSLILISKMRKQTALTRELYELFHKMKMATSAFRSDSDLLDMEKMLLSSNWSVENSLLVLQNLIKSQDEYHEVKRRFIDKYYDKLKDEVKQQHKEHSSELSQEQDNIRELQSEIDRNNREVDKRSRLRNELKLTLSRRIEELSSEKSTSTKHPMLLSKEPMSSSSSLPQLKKPQIQIPSSPQTKTQPLESPPTESPSEQKFTK